MVNTATESALDNRPGSIRDRQATLILEAATRAFSQSGFKATSVQSIADLAGVPKANVHYYFRNKETLYHAVLADIIALWNRSFEAFDQDDPPAVALDRLIRGKVRLSYTHADASRLFANEIIHGATHLDGYLKGDLRTWVRDRAAVIQAWIDDGLMAPVDPVHLIFLIWSSTQHYADFETQVLTVLNQAEYEEATIDHIADFLSGMILRGCGLTLPTRPAAIDA